MVAEMIINWKNVSILLLIINILQAPVVYVWMRDKWRRDDVPQEKAE